MHLAHRFQGLQSLLGLLGELADLVAPYRCAGCDSPVPSASISTVRSPFCSVCAAGLEPPDDPPPWVTVPYAWGGPLAAAIARAKYGDDPAPSVALGALLVPSATSLVGTIDRVIAVPLHPVRLAHRGYNQSVELSRAVARAVGARMDHGALVRLRDTPSQRDLGRAAREVNVRDAFAVRSPRALRGGRVLLVDDVVTTGATLWAARGALVAAGATVHCMALARAERVK